MAKAKLIPFPSSDDAAYCVAERDTEGAPEAEMPAAKLAVRPRLDNLDDSTLEDFASKYRFVRLVENGMSVREALGQADLKIKQRDGYYLVEKYKTQGKSALVDKRRLRTKRDATVLTPEVTDVIMTWYLNRAAAGMRVVAELSADTCRERNLPVPSESSVKNFLIKQAEGIKLASKGTLDLKKWTRAAASVVTQTKTTFANELWQGDHTQRYLGSSSFEAAENSGSRRQGNG